MSKFPVFIITLFAKGHILRDSSSLDSSNILISSFPSKSHVLNLTNTWKGERDHQTSILKGIKSIAKHITGNVCALLLGGAPQWLVTAPQRNECLFISWGNARYFFSLTFYFVTQSRFFSLTAEKIKNLPLDFASSLDTPAIDCNE